MLDGFGDNFYQYELMRILGRIPDRLIYNCNALMFFFFDWDPMCDCRWEYLLRDADWSCTFD